MGRVFVGSFIWRRPTQLAGLRVKPYSVAVPIRVVLAEDNYLVREGVRQLIDAQPELQVVAVCTDFESLLAAVEQHKPDVVLTDIRMPPTGTRRGHPGSRRHCTHRSAWSS